MILRIVDWKAIRLLVGVPCASRVEPATVHTLCTLLSALNTRGTPVSLSIQRGFLTSDARNLLVEQVLGVPADVGATHLLQIDSDMSFEPDVVIRMLERQVDVIGAPVRMKLQDALRYNVRFLPGPPAIERGALRVWGIGTALHLVTRRALERVAAVSPKYKFAEGAPITGVFDAHVDETGLRHLDDMAFAHRARSAGLDVWALLNAKTVHHEDAMSPGWPGEISEEQVRRMADALGKPSSGSAVLPAGSSLIKAQ